MPLKLTECWWDVQVTVLDDKQHTRCIEARKVRAFTKEEACRKVRWAVEENPYLSVVGQGTAHKEDDPRG
jgi:hypothetical protein